MSKKNISNDLKLDDKGLIPVIVQDYKTKDVLMLAYMNKESLQLTLRDKKDWFYSRSRNKLWLKGETSGHFQEVCEIHLDCDNDTLLVKVNQVGGIACHTGSMSCFYKKIDLETGEFDDEDNA
ncbi:MAG: phosphoribosyl-AMP cyclohydrolase [Candidatus Saelkia tenebricola]|nr:phosphoribosyl-AMP cyclohydrolase [Candidatus Saelkia tenebricola]